MRIVSVTATYQREEITVDTLNLLKLQEFIDSSVLVGSGPVERKAAERTGASYVEIQNHPLGAKWQAGVQRAREFNPDAVLICGSDDWLTSNWCSVCARQIEQGIDIVGKTNWCSCIARPNHPLQVMRIRYRKNHRKDPIGSGRLISRRVLDKLDWNLYPIHKDRWLDWESWARIKKVKGRLKLLNIREDIWLLCIRSSWITRSQWDTSKWSYQCEWGKVKHPREWLKNHFPTAPIDKYTQKVFQ